MNITENLNIENKNNQNSQNMNNKTLFNYIKSLFKDKIESIDFFIKIIKEQGGLKSLYNGMSTAIIGSIISYGVYFFTYQYWKDFMAKYFNNKGVVLTSLITSLLAAVCTAILSNPIWVLNSRIANNKV